MRTLSINTLGLFFVAALSPILLSGCTSLFFHPHSFLIDTPDRHGIEYQIENFEAADGTALNAWFFPAKLKDNDKAKATILYLHGNAENISTHFHSIEWLPAEGFNVLALDYRGFGASEGTPSLAGMQLDIDAAMGHLLTHNDVDTKRIVILGQSLGGPLAIYYAAHNSYRAYIRAVVADSAFYDYRQIAREKLAQSYLTWPFQWLPWLVINNNYSPSDSVAMVSPIPLLLIHGDQDAVVPLSHSQKLFDLAKEPKELWVIPGAGHIQSLSSEEVRKRLVEYLLRYTK